MVDEPAGPIADPPHDRGAAAEPQPVEAVDAPVEEPHPTEPEPFHDGASHHPGEPDAPVHEPQHDETAHVAAGQPHDEPSHTDDHHDAGHEHVRHVAESQEPEHEPDALSEHGEHEPIPVAPPRDDAAHEATDPHPDAVETEGALDPNRAAYDAVEQALGAALFGGEELDHGGFADGGQVEHGHVEQGHVEHGHVEHGQVEQEFAGGPDYIPMQTKPGALQYQPSISVRFGRLPNKVDLRPLMTPVEDQGDLACGVAYAVGGAYAYWIKRVTKQTREISPLFVDFNARWRDGSEAHAGSAIQLCLEALAKFGSSSLAAWPTDARLATQRPGAEAYQDAAPPRIQDLAQVPLRLQAWKQALAEGKPIIFGTALFEPADGCSQSGGVVQMPEPAEMAQAPHALQALCAVGYCDNEKVFIVRNSRGPHWGDEGYCYMPYAYVLNPRLNDGDCWVFVPKTSAQPPREAWSDDTRPVTNGGNGVDFDIEPYAIEDYGNVAVDLFEPERRAYNDQLPDDYARYVALAAKSTWHEMDGFDHEAALADAPQHSHG